MINDNNKQRVSSLGLKAENYKEILNYDVLKKGSLNFFDVVKNSNKFYTIELHKCDGYFRISTEYGRLGVTSKKDQRVAMALDIAEKEYNRLLKGKLSKGYKEVELAQSNTGSDKAKELVDLDEVKVKKVKKVKSKLHQSVQEFVSQIYKEAQIQLNYLAVGNNDNQNSSPLGKLTVNQINKGRSILQEISNIINNKTHIMIDDVLELSNKYYMHIPKAFGLRISKEDVAIRTLNEINDQMNILKFYEDSLRMGNIMYNDNIDERYKQLASDIAPLAKNTKMYKQLVDYVVNSQSRHHNVNLEVKRIFTLSQKNAPEFDDSVGNTKLLFHGTRSANLPGILSTHIKMPNQLKGVYITGAMFGPGIYFADQSTKSSQYACARFGGNPNKFDTAFLLVSEVALGRIKEEKDARYHTQAPAGYDSVKGVEGRSLLHNEYIIYRENQHQLKYIIEFEPKRRR